MTCLPRRDLGLLALRVGTGTVLVAHGTQKLFGWFGGHGISGAAQGMEAMGFRPARPSAIASAMCETGGGTLLALGLATPAAGAIAAGGMAAAVSVHVPNGFFNETGGLEHPGLLGWTAACIALIGPGRYSLDHVMGHCLNRSWMVPTALAASALGASVVISKRLRAQARSAEESAQPPGDEA
jgi:putative oxidoreductase